MTEHDGALGKLPVNEDWTEYDWANVFPATGDGKHYTSGDYAGTFPAGPLETERIEDVTAERIAEVLFFHAYSPEGGGGSVDLTCLARLTDGQYAYSEAWADYTGWGCQASAWWKVGPTLDSVVAVMSQERREQYLASAVPNA